MTAGPLWIRVAIPKRIPSLESLASLPGRPGLRCQGNHKGGHQVTRQAKTMMTRKITVMALIAGILLGAAATEGFNVYRQSHDSQIFQQRVRCKAIADAYVKANSTDVEANPDATSGVSVTLDKVDYSPARNSCVAELETAYVAPRVAIVSDSVQDLLSGETLFSAHCRGECQAGPLKFTEADDAFDYVINNASAPVALQKTEDLIEAKESPKSAPHP